MAIHENAQKQLKHYREIYQNIWDAILIADHNRVIVDCNPAFEYLFGYTLEEIEGKSTQFLYASETGYNEMADHLQSETTNRQERLLIPFTTKSGKVITCEIGAYPQYDEQNNETVGFIGVFRDLTEKIEQERRLKEERYMLSLVTDSSPVGIMFLNQNGDIDYVNQTAEQILGLSKEKILQRSYNDPKWQITDENGDPISDDQLPFNQAMKTGKPIYEAKHGIHLPDGHWKLLSINSAPIINGSPQIKGVVATIMDVTEQKKIEKDLAEKQQQLQVAYEAAELGTWHHDMIENRISFNENGLKHYGLLRSGVPIEEVFRRVHSDDIDRLQDEFIKTTAPGSGGEFATQYRVRHDDGSIRWLQVHVRVKFEGEGTSSRPIVGFGTSQDITDQKETEAELKKLYKGVEQSPAMVLITDFEGAIEYVNPQFLKTTGYSWKEVQGKNPRFIQSGETPKGTYQELWDTIKAGDTWQGEFVNRKKNGETYIFATSISPIDNEKGNITNFIAVGEDITRRRENEKRIARALDEKTVLLAEVHHRVKNNLAVISGLMELQIMNTPDAKELLETNQNRIQSIAQVHELLYQNDNFAEINFGQYIEKVITIVKSGFHSESLNVDINVSISDGLQVNANQAVPLGLITNELVTNSFAHAFGEMNDGIITINIQEEKEVVSFSYMDNGIGIDQLESTEDFNKHSSLGLELINILSNQVEAFDRKVDGKNGFRYIFKFTKRNNEAKGSIINRSV